MRSIAATICSIALLATSSRVYAQANHFAWERVGSEQSRASDTKTKGVSIRFGTTPDGSRDTLFAGNPHGVFRFDPGADDWTVLCEKSICRNQELVITKEGNILIGDTAGPSSGGVLSTDGVKRGRKRLSGHTVSRSCFKVRSQPWMVE